MNRNILWSLALNTCGLGLLAGCNMNSGPLAEAAGTVPTPSPPVTTTPPPAPPAHIVQPSIFVSQYGQEPISVLGFAGTPSGPNPLYVEVPGWLPAVDAAGNLYVVSCYLGVENGCTPDINVYPPDAIVPGKPARSLHTHLAHILDMKVSKTGVIFVSDGKGVAVFSVTSNGDDAPVRYIVPSFKPGLIAVDDSDNLYVESVDPSGALVGPVLGVAVFGPKDTGQVAPSRMIAGPSTPFDRSFGYSAMATDSQGNLYVAGSRPRKDGLYPYGVYEFGPSADGDASSFRYITTPGMDDGSYEGTGVAVDSAGNIYVSAALSLNVAAVFVFPRDASGSVIPISVITSPAFRVNAGGIALY
jgi:hypothetical protein